MQCTCTCIRTKQTIFTMHGLMKRRFIMSVPVIFLLVSLSHQGFAKLTSPEQISIAATENYFSLVVTWVTFDPTATSEVRYGLSNGGTPNVTLTADGSATKFDEYIVRYVHRVTIGGLTALRNYDYQCGSPANWSKVNTFRTLGNESTPFTFAFYGDFGRENAQSLPWLIKDATYGNIDGVLHMGDIAYNLHENDGRLGDEFMNQIQPIATKIPYMVSPGNHEFLNNFTQYKNRFSMPGNSSSLYYSWDVGPAHIISLNTECYFFPWDGLDLVSEHYKWLEEDLNKATSPEQRAKHPWIITMGHQPMYCTTNNNQDCNHRESIVRVGYPLVHKYGLENLFYEYGVDITLWAHEHIYERFWPLYDFDVKNGSIEHPYTDPGAPVHIVSGAAGCREKHIGDSFWKKLPDYVAFTSMDYGYSKITVYNSTHVNIKFISIDKSGKTVDNIMVIKHSHGPYV